MVIPYSQLITYRNLVITCVAQMLMVVGLRKTKQENIQNQGEATRMMPHKKKSAKKREWHK